MRSPDYHNLSCKFSPLCLQPTEVYARRDLSSRAVAAIPLDLVQARLHSAVCLCYQSSRRALPCGHKSHLLSIHPFETSRFKGADYSYLIHCSAREFNPVSYQAPPSYTPGDNQGRL